MDDYRYCVIDMPLHPDLQTMVVSIRASNQSFIKYGGQFDADSQQTNLVEPPQVKLFTMIDKEFPPLVRNQPGFVEYTQAEIMALLAAPEWTDPNAEP